MPEINLLPDELRGKENKELKSAQKKPSEFKVEMASPAKEKATPPLKEFKPSLLSRLFAKKLEPAQTPTASPSESFEGEARQAKEALKQEEEKVLHLPQMEEAEVDLSAAPPSFQASSNLEQKNKSQDVDSERIKSRVSPPLFKTTAEVAKPPQLQKESNFFDKLFFWRHKKKIKPAKSFAKETVLDVNLIPADLAKQPEAELSNKLFTSGIVVLIFILLVTAVYLGISWYQLRVVRQIGDVEAKIASLDQEIAQYEKDKSLALDLQQRLDLIHQLLNDHIYWTKFFGLLEKYTISEVYYSNFSMTGKDKLILSAIGKDYESVAKQLVAFQQATDFIKSVKIDAASAQFDPEELAYLGVKFNISLEFLPDVFLKPDK
ncbi:MAG: hypothetical protein WC675_05755 [Patescibacteria group bacterium]